MKPLAWTLAAILAVRTIIAYNEAVDIRAISTSAAAIARCVTRAQAQADSLEAVRQVFYKCWTEYRDTASGYVAEPKRLKIAKGGEGEGYQR